MRMMNVSLILVAAAITACGASKSEDAVSTAPKISEEAAKAEGAKLPAVAIIKVPVGADGVEQHDAAEMRLASGAETLDQSNIAGAFDAAQAPQGQVDELDQSSSTESFCGWIGWGRGFRKRYYANNYGWNWQFYRPTYLNYGYNYGYNYGGYYGVPAGQYGNNGYGNTQFNYYYYNRGFGNTYPQQQPQYPQQQPQQPSQLPTQQPGYSGQGWNPSVTYTGGLY